MQLIVALSNEYIEYNSTFKKLVIEEKVNVEIKGRDPELITLLIEGENIMDISKKLKLLFRYNIILVMN